eukprot:1904759-Pyramimonas_sp.AAC.1
MAVALVSAFRSPVFKALLEKKGGWSQESAHEWPHDVEAFGMEMSVQHRTPENQAEHDFWSTLQKNCYKVGLDGRKGNP